MREPERICRILEKLLEIWERDPDCRFGQLVHNIFWQIPETTIVDSQQVVGKFLVHKYGIDIFNVEDDAFELFLDKLIEKNDYMV